MTDNHDFDDLNTRLKDAETRSGLSKDSKVATLNGEKQSDESRKAMSRAFRIGVEMVSGLAVGCIFGLLIDRYFDTSPWGLIIFFFLGCGASILNVFRAVKGMGYKVGYRDNVPSQTPELHNDDDNRR